MHSLDTDMPQKLVLFSAATVAEDSPSYSSSLLGALTHTQTLVSKGIIMKYVQGMAVAF